MQRFDLKRFRLDRKLTQKELAEISCLLVLTLFQDKS